MCFYAYVTTRTIFIVSSQLIIQNIPESVLVLVRVTPQGITRSKTVFNFVQVTPITGHVPDITGYAPDITGYDPDITGHVPDIAGHVPDITGHVPDINI